MESRPALTAPLFCAIAALALVSCAEKEPAPPTPDAGPTLDTDWREHAFGAVTARGWLPRGWGTDVQSRLAKKERVADLDIVVMAIAVELIGSVDSARTKPSLEMQRRRALELSAVGGEKPEIVLDLEEREPGLWTLVTRVRESVHPNGWSYRAVAFRLPEAGSSMCVCTAEARLDWARYWQALRDICAGLHCVP